MKILIQRVSYAKVEVNAKEISSIGAGVLVFIGVKQGDSEAQVKWLSNKLINLRLFNDENGKINKSLLEGQKEILVVSQFTLYGDCSYGRRPSFIKAAEPELANSLYELFIKELSLSGLRVKTGIFGADMKVSLLNDGPVTLIIDKD